MMVAVATDRVLGVDACRAGWIGIALAGDQVSGYVAHDLDELVAAVMTDGELAVVGIDMPIGLADNGRRQADVLARQGVGPLWPSVFITPVRAALAENDHARCSARNRELAGEGVSRQAFSLRDKLLELDQWVGQAPCRVVEVHPELSFAALAAQSLITRKSSWAGACQRRELLADVGVVIGGDLGEAGRRAAVDDVLDAAVCAWTARCVGAGLARSLPDPPEVFSDGWPCAIWV
jgi:predicted RNase H-like nuclease